MKVKDLMIGDWVKIDTSQLPIQFEAIDFINNMNGLLDVEPIPLTEEILKANDAYDGKDGRSITIDCHYIGLKDVVSLCEYKGDFEISVLTCVDMTGEPNEVYDLPSVKYVHELQHALRLCGLRDLADNFKIE